MVEEAKIGPAFPATEKQYRCYGVGSTVVVVIPANALAIDSPTTL